MLHKKFRIEPESVEKEAIKKIKFAVEMYDKYRTNMAEKSKFGIIINDTKSEDTMLLENIENSDFYKFKKELEAYSNMLLKKFTGVV